MAALDHPGDTLLDWMTGTAVDDATNEVQRVADVQFVIDALLADRALLPPLATVDAGQVAVVGHSYGGFTALAVAGVETPDPRIRGVAGLQPFARSLSRKVIARIAVPTLLIVGTLDETCPPDTDADRVTDTIVRPDARRFDFAAAGHQACSDVGLYLELESQVDGVPDIVAAFLASMADQITGRAGDPWRPTVGLHLHILGAWLADVLGTDPDGAARELDAVEDLVGVTARTRLRRAVRSGAPPFDDAPDHLPQSGEPGDRGPGKACSGRNAAAVESSDHLAEPLGREPDGRLLAPRSRARVSTVPAGRRWPARVPRRAPPAASGGVRAPRGPRCGPPTPAAPGREAVGNGLVPRVHLDDPLGHALGALELVVHGQQLARPRRRPGRSSR